MSHNTPPPTATPFTHLNQAGQVHMVDVSAKTITVRTATAQAFVACSAKIMQALQEGSTPKGDVFALVRIAGIQAAKKVPDLIPLAHVIGIHGATVETTIHPSGVLIQTSVTSADRTGVEMEALTCANIAALTLVDMVKGIDRDITITDCYVTSKSGGRSGDWQRPASSSVPAAQSE